jgi:hypothetical protein
MNPPCRSNEISKYGYADRLLTAIAVIPLSVVVVSPTGWHEPCGVAPLSLRRWPYGATVKHDKTTGALISVVLVYSTTRPS